MATEAGDRIGAYVVDEGGGLVAHYTPAQREKLGLEPEGRFWRWVWDPEKHAEMVAMAVQLPRDAPIAPVYFMRRRRTWQDLDEGPDGQGRFSSDDNDVNWRPDARPFDVDDPVT